MKNLILILLFLSVAISLAAQEKVWLDKNYQWTDNESQAVRYAIVTKEEKLTKVEEFSLDGQKKDIWHFEKYASEPRKRIRKGLHTRIYANGTDSLVEMCNENRLEGQRLVYYPDGSMHFAISFKGGLLNGKFIQYYPDGKLRREEMYLDGKCTGGKLLAADGNELEFQPYEVVPTFPGGINALMQLVSKVVKYPASAVQARTEGKVVITFYVDKDGSMASPEILQSVSPDIDKEGLRAFNAIAQTFKWTPGYQDGKAVRVRYTLPINFRLPQK